VDVDWVGILGLRRRSDPGYRCRAPLGLEKNGTGLEPRSQVRTLL
jgi:hypothetical protein